MEVRTRALSMAEEREEEAKRRKLDSGGELELSSSSSSLNQQHKNHRRPLVIISSDNIPVSPENSTITTRLISSDRCSSTTSWREQLTSSRCSSNGILRSADIDPESEDCRLQNSTYFTGDRARREATHSSDLISKKSNQMPSLEANSLRNSSNAEKMPSEAEIESFFSEAEKEDQKRFTERYNYDIVKDVPLEGRFIWVPVKP